MSNTADSAFDDSQILYHAVQSAEDLASSLDDLKSAVDEIADGSRDMDEDTYDRVLGSISIGDIARKLDSAIDEVYDCADKLRNA